MPEPKENVFMLKGKASVSCTKTVRRDRSAEDNTLIVPGVRHRAARGESLFTPAQGAALGPRAQQPQEPPAQGSRPLQAVWPRGPRPGVFLVDRPAGLAAPTQSPGQVRESAGPVTRASSRAGLWASFAPVACVQVSAGRRWPADSLLAAPPEACHLLASHLATPS